MTWNPLLNILIAFWRRRGGRLPGSRTVYQGFEAVFPGSEGLPRFGAMGFPRVWSECTGDSSVLNCFFFIHSSKPLQIQGTLLPTLGRLFQTPGMPFPVSWFCRLTFDYLQRKICVSTEEIPVSLKCLLVYYRRL